MENVSVLLYVWLDLFLIFTVLPAVFKSSISLASIAVLRPALLTSGLILGVNGWKRRP
jgi:hypothetical protein